MQNRSVASHVVSLIATITKYHTVVVVGLVALLTRLAISALPGGQLDYLLDKFFAIVHTAWVHCSWAVIASHQSFLTTSFSLLRRGETAIDAAAAVNKRRARRGDDGRRSDRGIAVYNVHHRTHGFPLPRLVVISWIEDFPRFLLPKRARHRTDRSLG